MTVSQNPVVLPRPTDSWSPLSDTLDLFCTLFPSSHIFRLRNNFTKDHGRERDPDSFLSSKLIKRKIEYCDTKVPGPKLNYGVHSKKSGYTSLLSENSLLFFLFFFFCHLYSQKGL